MVDLWSSVVRLLVIPKSVSFDGVVIYDGALYKLVLQRWCQEITNGRIDDWRLQWYPNRNDTIEAYIMEEIKKIDAD